jgi:hypothetical protein
MAATPASGALSVEASWTAWHTLGLLLVIVATALVGLLMPAQSRLWAWTITLILLAIFAAVAGHGITGRWLGVLIDDRNKMSLSRLQMLLWTILILSGFATAALANVAGAFGNPLAIAIPSELWAAMGISTTSLVGSPLILSSKRASNPNPDEYQQTLALLKVQGVDTAQVSHEGQVVVKAMPAAAQVADLFKGEETGNAAQLDLGKVQMFYFTFVLVLVYAVALGTLFLTGIGKPIDTLPKLDGSMVALLAISHAGYLTNKVVPHSQTA